MLCYFTKRMYKMNLSMLCSPYSTGNNVRVCAPNPCVPNVNYVPLARIGAHDGHKHARVGHHLLASGVALVSQGFLDTNMLV